MVEGRTDDRRAQANAARRAAESCEEQERVGDLAAHVEVVLCDPHPVIAELVTEDDLLLDVAVELCCRLAG